MLNNYVHQKIAKQLLELIDSGVHLPGSQLPSERALAQHFGVGRATIRNAQQLLQMLGRLQIRPGSGVYVTDTRPHQLNGLPKVGPLELTEARALFEAESAALAAPIITDETIAQLENYIAIMSGKVQSDMTSNEADAAFHKAIASSTKNSMIIFVIDSMWKLRTENPELEKVYQKVCDTNSSHLEDEHKAILEALRNRDSNAARKAMREHFSRMIEALLDASEKEAYQRIQRKAKENRSRFLLTKKIA